MFVVNIAEEHIKEITVHWSESEYINNALGNDEDGDIEKTTTFSNLDKIVKEAAKKVGAGYDKTSMTVFLTDGTKWANECKFYLTKETSSLIELLED